MGEVGADPTVPEGNGFTVRRSCRFATLPYYGAGEGSRTLNPIRAGDFKSPAYACSATPAYKRPNY